MPVRNVTRYKAPNTYYHVYNRGHNKGLIFKESSDYSYFTFLLERCFGKKQLISRDGRPFPWFGDRIELLAFCLMPNHYHLLLHQGDDDDALSKAVQSFATTYSLYFNKKYHRRGSIFESSFKASPILNDAYLMHITRYIHLNPKDYQKWPHSSYRDFLIPNGRNWVHSTPVLNMFSSKSEYKAFISDYKELKKELDNLRHELADYGESY